ncbi:MAG: hypothetical protein KIS80_10670, partial [Anaerolineales bacterium]|nr:hypothetical protein [Anaerolineales bacterium]
MAAKSSKKSGKSRWEAETLQPALDKHPERKPAFETTSGLALPPLLSAEDLPPDTDLGYPGEFPFTRGV